MWTRRQKRIKPGSSLPDIGPYHYSKPRSAGFCWQADIPFKCLTYVCCAQAIEGRPRVRDETLLSVDVSVWATRTGSGLGRGRACGRTTCEPSGSPRVGTGTNISMRFRSGRTRARDIRSRRVSRVSGSVHTFSASEFGSPRLFYTHPVYTVLLRPIRLYTVTSSPVAPKDRTKERMRIETKSKPWSKLIKAKRQEHALAPGPPARIRSDISSDMYNNMYML